MAIYIPGWNSAKTTAAVKTVQAWTPEERAANDAQALANKAARATSSNPLSGVVKASDALQNYSDQAVGATKGVTQAANGFIGASSDALGAVGLGGLGASNTLALSAGNAPTYGETPATRIAAPVKSGGLVAWIFSLFK